MKQKYKKEKIYSLSLVNKSFQEQYSSHYFSPEIY